MLSHWSITSRVLIHPNAMACASQSTVKAGTNVWTAQIWEELCHQMSSVIQRPCLIHISQGDTCHTSGNVGRSHISHHWVTDLLHSLTSRFGHQCSVIKSMRTTSMLVWSRLQILRLASLNFSTLSQSNQSSFPCQARIGCSYTRSTTVSWSPQITTPGHSVDTSLFFVHRMWPWWFCTSMHLLCGAFSLMELHK